MSKKDQKFELLLATVHRLCDVLEKAARDAGPSMNQLAADIKECGDAITEIAVGRIEPETK